MLPLPLCQVTEVREDSAKLKQAVEDMHKAAQREPSGGGGMGIFPLAVCAQCLVVSALLLYSGFGGGGGKAKNKGYLD